MDYQIDSARKVLAILNEKGHDAYFVGGFVRDYLLKLPTEDIDITTSATPQQVMSYFTNSKPTGLKFGTVTVFVDNHAFEVTTFRKEGNYLNYRHPGKIEYSSSIEEDLKRRDFTINALAMGQNGEIIDLFHGKSDLENKIIRAIGDPFERFNEDALRIMRAFRFVSKLGFTIESETLLALTDNRMLIQKIANERVAAEIKKIILAPFQAEALRLMHQAKITDALPSLSKGVEFLSRLQGYSLDLQEFYALCFCLNQEEIPESWRFSNKERNEIQTIVDLIEITQHDEFNEMIIYADGLDVCLKANNVNKLINSQNNQEEKILAIWNSMPIHSTCELKFKGDDILQNTEITDAKIIGQIIDEIIIRVITGTLKNDFDEINAFVRQYMLQI